MKLKLFVVVGMLVISCQPNNTELVGHIGRPAVSPNGNQIAFIYAKDASNDVWEVFVADADGKNVKQVTNMQQARIKKGPVWSPDGKQILFHADINDGAQIFAINENGENLIQLTDLSGYNAEPNWSPTGDEIIFNTVPEQGKVQMLIMNKDGSNIRSLYNPDGHNWYPRVTPQDDIIFTSDVNQENYYDIFRMTREGSNLQQLTSVKAINWFPEYSPDGTKIVFHSNQDDPTLNDAGDYNLYMMNVDGSDLQQLTELEGQELHAKWFPSGNKLIFEWHSETAKGLYTLDIVSGEITKIKLTY